MLTAKLVKQRIAKIVAAIATAAAINQKVKKLTKMTHHEYNRRHVVSTGVGVLTLTLSGCSGLLGDETSTPGPDAGTDSYGVFVENQTADPQKLHVEVTQPFGDETPLDETMSMDGGATRNWNRVITNNAEYVVKAAINDAIDASGKSDIKSDSMYVTPGSEDAPDVEDMKIRIDEDEQVGVFVDVHASKK